MFIVSLIYKQTKTLWCIGNQQNKMVKSKQTIERTIKQIKEMGFDTEMYETNIETIDKYKEEEVITTLYYNDDLEMGIYVNFQEVGYPTLFEINHYVNDEYECGTRRESMKEVKGYVNWWVGKNHLIKTIYKQKPLSIVGNQTKQKTKW